MWLFITGAILGGIIGMGILLILQGANMHQYIMNDSEDEK